MTAPAVAGPRWPYWFGAALDAAMLVPLLWPDAAAAMLGLGAFTPTPAYLYATRLAAALMAGWTVLLLWGAREPVARRGLLVITAVPVVVGLAAAGVAASADGLVQPATVAPIWGLQALTLLVLTVGYRRAGRAAST